VNEQFDQAVKVGHGDVLRSQPGGPRPGEHAVDIDHVVVVAQRQAHTGRLVAVGAEGGCLAGPAGHELALGLEARLLALVFREQEAETIRQGRAEDAQLVADAKNRSRIDGRLRIAARVLQADQPGPSGHGASLAGGDGAEEADLLGPGQQDTDACTAAAGTQDVQRAQRRRDARQVVAGRCVQMVPGDDRLGTPATQRPTPHVTGGHRRGPAQARHDPLEGTGKRIEPRHRRPVAPAGAIEDFYDGVGEVGIVHAPSKLQLNGPLVETPAHDKPRVVEVRRDEDRPLRRGRPARPARRDDKVPRRVAVQIECTPLLDPFGHPLDHPILAACRSRYARQRHEPSAVLGSS